MNLYHIKYQTDAYDEPLINKQAADSEYEAIQKYIKDGFDRKEIIYPITTNEKGGLIG